MEFMWNNLNKWCSPLVVNPADPIPGTSRESNENRFAYLLKYLFIYIINFKALRPPSNHPINVIVENINQSVVSNTINTSQPEVPPNDIFNGKIKLCEIMLLKQQNLYFSHCKEHQ